MRKVRLEVLLTIDLLGIRKSSSSVECAVRKIRIDEDISGSYYFSCERVADAISTSLFLTMDEFTIYK